MADEEEERGLEADDANVEEVKKQKRTAKQQEAYRRECFQKVMATKEGRHVLYDILAGLGTYQTPLVPGAQDLTYVAIGRQNAGLELTVTLAEYSHANYLKMQQEN